MNPRTQGSMCAVLCILFSSLWTAAAADKPVRVSGGGGFPLTPSVTSMWGAVDELVVPGKKPHSFMVYFRGSDGWHQRKWTFNQQGNADPFLIEFICDLTTLRVTVDRSSRTMSLFGHDVDLAKANVVLVDHVDQPGHEAVTLLGVVDLVAPEDANPAVWVLEQNERIASAVVGTGQ